MCWSKVSRVVKKIFKRGVEVKKSTLTSSLWERRCVRASKTFLLHSYIFLILHNYRALEDAVSVHNLQCLWMTNFRWGKFIQSHTDTINSHDHLDELMSSLALISSCVSLTTPEAHCNNFQYIQKPEAPLVESKDWEPVELINCQGGNKKERWKIC